MADLIYSTDIIKFKVPRARLPLIRQLAQRLANDIADQCPVATGKLKASIFLDVVTKKA